MTPYEIAFGADPEGDNKETGFERMTDRLFDFLFFLDIIVTFHSAIITDDHNVIDDKKLIAHEYLRGWFVTDVLSCIPYGDLGSMILSKKARTKIQVIKLIKLLRISKIVKEKQKIFKYMELYMGIENTAFQRLSYFSMIFMITCHVVTTAWLIEARFVGADFHGTWRANYRNLKRDID